jgi:hypothetical protein
LKFLKIPEHAACLGFPFEVPSVLHLHQPCRGGDQMTSIIMGAFGGWITTLKNFRISKSEMVELLVRLVQFLDKLKPKINVRDQIENF